MKGSLFLKSRLALPHRSGVMIAAPSPSPSKRPRKFVMQTHHFTARVQPTFLRFRVLHAYSLPFLGIILLLLSNIQSRPPPNAKHQLIQQQTMIVRRLLET